MFVKIQVFPQDFPHNWSSPMCDGLFLPMKDAQRQRRRKTDRWGGESGEAHRQRGNARKDKGRGRKKNAKPERETRGKNDSDSMKERN